MFGLGAWLLGLLNLGSSRPAVPLKPTTVHVLRIEASSVNVATIGASANVARVLPSTANVIQIATSAHVATIQPTQAKVAL